MEPADTGMRYFRRLEAGIDVAPLLRELSDHPEVWTLDTRRQGSIDVQRETESAAICRHAEQLTFLEERQRSAVRYVGRPTRTARLLPKTLEFVQHLARQLHGIPGRAVVVRLKPRGRVYEHIDGGIYYELRHRYHLVLRSVAGSRLRSGNEEVRMQEGELWWFENRQPHAAANDSDEDRIHLIVDILSLRSVASLFVRLFRSPGSYVRRLLRRLRRR
jgi:hypothetical protein